MPDKFKEQKNRILRAIEKREVELRNSRQSWQEWIYLHNLKAIVTNKREIL